jgi:hypothetical protein
MVISSECRRWTGDRLTAEDWQSIKAKSIAAGELHEK